MSRCLINTMWAGDERNRKGVGWREWILKWKGILIISPHTAARALYRVSIMMAPISCIPFATPFNAQSTSIKRLRLTTPSLTTAHLRLHGHYCSFYELGSEMREMGVVVEERWRSRGGGGRVYQRCCSPAHYSQIELSAPTQKPVMNAGRLRWWRVLSPSKLTC